MEYNVQLSVDSAKHTHLLLYIDQLATAAQAWTAKQLFQRLLVSSLLT